MNARPSLADLPWAEVCEESLDGFDAPPDDRYRVESISGEGAAAYGEIPSESASRLLRWLAPTPADVLFDLGCGTGKLCLQAICTTSLGAAWGVELSAFRHAAAEASRAKLLARAAPAAAAWLRERLTFLRDDFREVDLGAATLVYAGATAYPDALLVGMAKNVARAPKLRALVTTRPLPEEGAALFSERGRFRLPMSWSSHERVTVYERRGQLGAGSLPWS